MTVDEVARVRAIVEPFDLPWYRADEGAFDKDYSTTATDPNPDRGRRLRCPGRAWTGHADEGDQGGT